MKKTELFAFSILILLYINKILNLIEIPLFVLINFISFLTLSISGYKLYRPKKYISDDKATFFAIYCGFSFSFGLIAFGAKVWNHSNTVALVLSIPNFILFLFLLFKSIKSRQKESLERRLFYKKILIRSSVIVTIVVTIVAIPTYIINAYINKDEPVLHNRGLAELYYQKSIDLSSNNNFVKGLTYAKKSLNASEIAWGESNTVYYKPHEALYKSYLGLIKKEFQNGNEEKVIEYYKAIKKPIKIWYGDSSKQQAIINTYAAKIYQTRENYKFSDSLYIESLNYLSKHSKTKNIFYTRTLNLLANSYRDQYYYDDAENLYKNSIHYLEKDTTRYVNSRKPSETKYIIPNGKARTYAELAWNYSLSKQWDKASEYFELAFKIPSFKNTEVYSTAKTRHAYNILNKGDFNKAKTLMENALKITHKKHGKTNYYYLDTLDGLNSINTSLANYKEAEKGCINAISLLEEITDTKDDYYANFIYALGQVKYYQAHYNEALKLFNEALRYTNKKSIQYADILGSLANLNTNLTKYSIALYQAEKASEIASNYFNDDTNSYLTKYFRNEAYSNYLIGKYNKADKLYTRCFSIDTIHKNQEKTSFASTLNGIGLIKTNEHKFIEADSLFENSLKIYKNKIGHTHPNYATILYNKAYLRLKQGNYDASKRLFNNSLNIIQNTISNKHDKVADNLVGLGEVHIKQQDYQEALGYFNKAIIIYKGKFDEVHKKIILTKNYIAYCNKKQNTK